MDRRTWMASAAGALRAAWAGTNRPNIVWIITEDMGPQWGCYGYPLVRTPNFDRLANEGALFRRAFATAPVCSASRSAFQTGMYQTSTGAHHHRSHRDDGYRLPAGVRLISHWLRDRGYHTIGYRGGIPGLQAGTKLDFNFTADAPFEGSDWRQRPKDKPFFAQIHMRDSHKGPSWEDARKETGLVDPDKIELPPYYPDHPVVRDEFANYLDAVNLADKKVGRILEAIDAEGLTANTLVMVMGDNGRCLLRGKQWCYDAGVHVPMAARWPGVFRPGTVREDPALSLDLSATTLWAAGVPLPENLHGRPLAGEKARPREWAATARDRCDMTLDRVRAIRTVRYNYIRNFMPERPYTQHNQYIEESYPTLGVLKELAAKGKLTREQALFLAPRKPVEELYDADADPHEVRNLAGSAAHGGTLAEMRARLDRWMAETRDRGAEPEPHPPAEMNRRAHEAAGKARGASR